VNRRVTNAIRFVMDECVPPILRDSALFMWPFYVLAYRGRNLRTLMHLKRDIWSFTPEQYRDLYANLDSVSRHRATDLNQRCIDRLTQAVAPSDTELIDVGCGGGFFVRHLHEHFPDKQVTGLDIVPPERPLPEGTRFVEGDIAALQLDEDSYDVVFCSHVLEHLLDYRAVMRQLVRAARRRVCLVVPRQRPYYYTLDEHVNFFLFPEAFAHDVGLASFTVEVLDGDICYIGEVAP
jgi:trans-aconitate methyltransferase